MKKSAKLSTTRLYIHVEGISDKQIVEHILKAANIVGDIEVIPSKGKWLIAQVVKDLVNTEDVVHIALIDSDIVSVPDSRDEARKQLGNPEIEVFCAVPTVEAWLFADFASAMRGAKSIAAKEILRSAPLPEDIPSPKHFAEIVFRNFRDRRERYSFLRDMDILAAEARSPSLRSFLNGVRAALSIQHQDSVEGFVHRTMFRDIVATLLRELPGNEIAWKTLEGQLSANQLYREVYEGSDVGRQYVTELFRVARDLIARKSRR